MTMTVETKRIKIDDLTAKEHIGKTVYGISGYPYGILEEVRTAKDGSQEFWVKNYYGLIHVYCDILVLFG